MVDSYLFKVYIYVIKHHYQKLQEQKRLYLCLHVPFTAHHEGKSREKPKARIESETMEGCCLLAYFLWLAKSVFLYTPGPPTTMDLTLSHQSLINKMPTKTCLQTNHIEAFFLSCHSFFSDHYSCVKL